MKLKGFSLIEIIVSITIISLIGLLSSGLITRTYRSTSQADLLGTLRQNGQVALSTIEADIKNAEAVVCYSAAKDRMVVRTLLGKYNRYRFVPPVPPTGRPTSNGYIDKEEDLNFTHIQTFCNPAAIPNKEPVVLTNKDLNSGVSISNGQFIGTPSSGGKDTITIKFNVNPPGGNYTGNSMDFIEMQTTIRVRNETWR